MKLNSNFALILKNKLPHTILPRLFFKMSDGCSSSPLSSPPKSISDIEDSAFTTSPVKSAPPADEGPSIMDQLIEMEEAQEPAPSNKSRRAAAAPRKTAQDKKWEAPFVYTDAR